MPALADDWQRRAARKRDRQARRHELPVLHLVRAGAGARQREDHRVWKVDGEFGELNIVPQSWDFKDQRGSNLPRL